MRSHDQSKAEGTLLTQRDEIEWRIPRFQLPIARATVSRDLRRQLSNLKRLLETAGPDQTNE